MLSKLSKTLPLDSCIAQKTAKNGQLSKLSKIDRLDSSKKSNVFNAVQLSKLSTLINKGKELWIAPSPFRVYPARGAGQ